MTYHQVVNAALSQTSRSRCHETVQNTAASVCEVCLKQHGGHVSVSISEVSSSTNRYEALAHEMLCAARVQDSDMPNYDMYHSGFDSA